MTTTQKPNWTRYLPYIILIAVALAAIGFGVYFHEWGGPAIIIAFLVAIYLIFFRGKKTSNMT